MEVTGQWADSLLAIERLYLLKLAIWGALSVALATAILAGRAVRSARAPLLSSLAASLAVLGVVELATALVLRQGVGLRDLGSATALDRGLWLTAGIAIGLSLGAVVATYRALRRRHDAGYDRIAGIGIGVATHGVALAVLSLQLARAVVR